MTIERSPAGAGSWTAVCTDSSAPYNCSLDTTTLADGTYELRAVARDVAGNTSTSTVVAARIVDNHAPSVTLAPPPSDVRGTITLTATAADSGHRRRVGSLRALAGRRRHVDDRLHRREQPVQVLAGHQHARRRRL